MKKILGLALGAAALVFLSACASTGNSGYHTTRYPDSNTLRANVKTALWQDPAVAPFDIGVDVSHSTAHLTGTVDTLEQKQRAGAVALAVPGISSVDNDLVFRSGSVISAGVPGRVETGRVVVEDPGVLLSRVVTTPDVYYGKTLDLEGSVDSVLSPNSFTMFSSGLRDNPVLVVTRDRDLRGITPGDVVRVRGEVEPFNRTAAAQRYSADLDARKFDQWASRPAILADSVRRF
jgi:hyperosmotically inducible protein